MLEGGDFEIYCSNYKSKILFFSESDTTEQKQPCEATVKL